jgi:RimJ/RimL family protein N-acetyltransferase
MNIIFETPRLILRQFTEADAHLFLQLNSNPEVLKYLHEPPLETEEQALHIINTVILPQYRITWAARLYILNLPMNLLVGAV